jgi:hypothetical protein
MNAFYEHHQDSIRFEYRCFDRLLLNGIIQSFQQPERVLGFFNAYRDGKRVTRRYLGEIADQFQNWVKNRATKWGAAILEDPDEKRRDEFVQPYFAQAKPDQVVAILKAREPARILIANGSKDDESPHLEFKQRWVNQYNFYLHDSPLGPHVRAHMPVLSVFRAHLFESTSLARRAHAPGGHGLPTVHHFRFVHVIEDSYDIPEISFVIQADDESPCLTCFTERGEVVRFEILDYLNIFRTQVCFEGPLHRVRVKEIYGLIKRVVGIQQSFSGGEKGFGGAQIGDGMDFKSLCPWNSLWLPHFQFWLTGRAPPRRMSSSRFPPVSIGYVSIAP